MTEINSLFNALIFFREKYQDTLEVLLFTRMPLEVPKLPNYPYVQKNTLYKVIIHSNPQALFTRIPFKHKFLYLSDYSGPLYLTV